MPAYEPVARTVVPGAQPFPAQAAFYEKKAVRMLSKRGWLLVARSPGLTATCVDVDALGEVAGLRALENLVYYGGSTKQVGQAGALRHEPAHFDEPREHVHRWYALLRRQALRLLRLSEWGERDGKVEEQGQGGKGEHT